MINLFKFAPVDQSLKYLGQIFGNMNGVIPSQATPLSLLGTMFMTFNSIVLVIGTLIVVYTTVVGLLMTAHEGEFMKKWNSLWTPVRTVLGIAALVPTGSGYSGIQMIMMWVIVQGIGAADMLWNTALNYVQVMGSVQSQLSLPGVSAYQTMTQLFEGLVCDATAHVPAADPMGQRNYYCSVPTNRSGSFCSGTISTFDPSSTSFSLGPPTDSCGKLTYCDPNTACSAGEDSIKCKSCRAQLVGLQSVITTLSAIAVTFAQDDFKYRDWYANSKNNINNSNWQMMYDYCKKQNITKELCCVPPLININNACRATYGANNFPGLNGTTQADMSDDVINQVIWPYSIQPTYGSDFLYTATNEYMTVLSQAVNDYIMKQVKDGSQALTGQLLQASQTGWLMAGSFYYTVASVNNDNLKDALPTLSMDAKPPIGETRTVMTYYRNNVSAANTLVSAASGGGGMGSGSLSVMGGVATSASAGTSGAFNNAINSHSNPLATLAATGYTLLMIAQILFMVFLAITIVFGFVGNIDVAVLGTGVLNPLGPAMLLVYLLLMPALLFVFGILITYGGLLGVYVPLIPYVVFTVGSIGWFISTIEAMVAGPLVALGIIAPGGQHEILGHASHALLLLLNIFLRPSLMIFGLMASMLLASAMVSLVNSAFSTVMTQIASMSTGADTSTGAFALAMNPLETVFFLAAYISLIVTTLNKCFATIYLLPQQVITWIGGHAGAGAGEAEALSEQKHAVEGAGAGVKQAGKGTVDTGQQGAKAAWDSGRAKPKQPGTGGVDVKGKGKPPGTK